MAWTGRAGNWITMLVWVLGSAMLAGCGSGSGTGGSGASETTSTASAAAGKVQVDFWHYFSEAQARPLKNLLAQFEAANPDISVKPILQGNPRELKQKLDSSFAAVPSNNPVLATVYESWTDDFVARGYMDEVENYFAGDVGLTKEEQDDIVKVFREGNSWNGKMVTMPFNKSIYLFYVNADKLAAAGYTTAPQTQQQLVEAVKKSTVSAGGRISTYGFGLSPRSEAFTTLLFARGADLVTTDDKPLINSPEAVEVLTMLRDFQFPTKHMYVDPNYMSTPFGNQQIAMYIYSSASLPYNKKNSEGKFRYEAAPVPGVEGREPSYVMQGTNLGIFANHDAARRTAAWKLIRFLTNAKNSALFVTEAGYMPMRYSVLQEPVMQQYMKDHPDYALAANLVLSDKGKQEPRLGWWEGVRNDLDSMVDNVLARGSDPKAALDDAQKKAVDRAARYK